MLQQFYKFTEILLLVGESKGKKSFMKYAIIWVRFDCK